MALETLAIYLIAFLIIGIAIRLVMKRYGVELALRDAAGQTIGALSVGFRHQGSDDEKAFLSKAEQVRDELQKRIPSLEKLVELDP